jgi:hypothetical protein
MEPEDIDAEAARESVLEILRSLHVGEVGVAFATATGIGGNQSTSQRNSGGGVAFI